MGEGRFRIGHCGCQYLCFSIYSPCYMRRFKIKRSILEPSLAQIVNARQMPRMYSRASERNPASLCGAPVVASPWIRPGAVGASSVRGPSRFWRGLLRTSGRSSSPPSCTDSETPTYQPHNPPCHLVHTSSSPRLTALLRTTSSHCYVRNIKIFRSRTG